MDLGVVLVVAYVRRDVDVVAADATVFVDLLPERGLRIGDRLAERGERANGQVGDGAKVDAAVVGVDALRACLFGNADVRRDGALIFGCFSPTPVIVAATTAGGEQHCSSEQCSKADDIVLALVHVLPLD